MGFWKTKWPNLELTVPPNGVKMTKEKLKIWNDWEDYLYRQMHDTSMTSWEIFQKHGPFKVLFTTKTAYWCQWMKNG